ncbi:uncharacterized protein SPSC_02725 [Sporisorium scitamineum]|uniref:Uncharacterized protein n=1 Tax=Sporisorium scitamineum TaxID=49012 RepID=A0A0F7SDL0_9BASI|nr:uncharacterized protein SPSC_02725 [Sporisorium scitamineum]CDW99650.1 hypothetical protein [Sporisorium scitamineum]
MTTATPLSLPIVFDQNNNASASHYGRRRWKTDRPNYRAILIASHSKSAPDLVTASTSSRLQQGPQASPSHNDHDQFEAELEKWGLASSSRTSKLAPPTSALSWDENSVHASCSYLRNNGASTAAIAASLDQWDPSISFAPYSSSGLDPFNLRQSNAQPITYRPDLGRVVAVGRDDGTVSIYRAYGRLEDYGSLSSRDSHTRDADDSLPASASASANLSQLSRSPSRRSSIISSASRLRSPEIETPSIRLPSSAASKSILSSGRESSPLLPTFPHVDRSSLAARSTISAASVSSTVAANVQIDEGLPASSLQSNINATGHTAGRTFGEQAEDRLELQMAAAERNDHQHGVVGGVIERLGFSSHSHSPSSHPHSPKEHSRHNTSHRVRTSESRQSPVTRPNATPSSETLPAVSEHSNFQPASHKSASPAVVDASKLPTSADAWLHDPTRGEFGQLMTLYTSDRSAIVALRIVPLPMRTENGQESPPSSAPDQPSLDKTALLVVQEAGHVSLWSVLEGTMLWQLDVTVATVTPVNADSLELPGKEVSASLGVMHSLSRQLPAAIGTPLSRSPAGSVRASPRPPTVATGDASVRRSMLRAALSSPDASTNSRLREIHGVKLAHAVQTFQVGGTPVALLWDSHSMSVLILDLTDGRLLLREAVDDVAPANTPAIHLTPGSEDRMELVWFSHSELKLQRRPIRMLVSEAAGSQAPGDASGQMKQLQVFLFDTKAEDDATDGKLWALPAEDAQAENIHFAANRVVLQSSTRLSVLDVVEGHLQFTQEAETGHFKRLCGSSRNAQHILVQTLSGLARLDFTPSKRVEQQHKDPDAGKASFTLLASHTPSRLCLAWNLPGSGELLDKSFLLQPLASDISSANEAPGPSELAAFDLTTGQIEDLVASPKSEEATLNRDDPSAGAARITALLPLSLERIAVASSGGIQILSLLSIAAGATGGSLQADDGALVSTAAIGNSLGADHEICLLRSAVAPRSGQRLIIGGTLQGEIGFWQANTGPTQGPTSTSAPQLEALLSVSTTPVEALVVFGDEDNTIRLHGCVACVCADSSLTVVLLEGFRLLYTVPGRGARLTSLAVRADELLLTYDDDKARVWDLRTQELRRSIATDQAQALVEDGKGWWTVKDIEPFSPLHSRTTGVLSQLACARDDAAASLLVNFRRAIEAAARAVRGSGQGGAKEDAAPRSGTTNSTSLQPSATLRSEQEYERTTAPQSVGLGSPAARKAVNIVRPLLPTVFPTGLDADMDAKLAALLDLEEPASSCSTRGGYCALSVGLHSAPDALMVGGSVAPTAAKTGVDVKKAWKLSSRLTTTRLLVASALLRVLSHVSELQDLAMELQQFVEDEARLASLVEVGFRGVTLTELVPYWLDSNSELQNASRSMFQLALARLEEVQLDELCSQWQGLLSSAKTQMSKSRVESSGSASTSIEEAELQRRVLALVGGIAVERYTSLSPRMLKDIASIIHGAIVSDKGSEMRTPQELQMLGVAIELCRSGFSMWQHYFDAAEVVRSLFALSTSSSSSSNSGANGDGELRTLARAATLQIAAENTPLFMTTLSLDILHARSPAHCSATMRLVAFMVRKRPSVLVANLPRLAEAVVKSLDPTHTTMREAVVNAATVMISELVSTYPSVSFFGAGQRLAVGTNEGAVIMYDLKTATRLYVLEGHRRRADAASFSPDGRRLVTMSLEEGRVLVWKTSSGFSSFFSPGQMPRQGATDVRLTDGAYKAFLFNVGEQQQGLSGSQRVSMVGDGVVGMEGQLAQEQDFVGFDKIGFQWNSERSVKVQIGEAQLNISVD